MSGHPFKPGWWLPGSHLQTLWPTVCRIRVKNLPLERERLELPDGDFIDLDWMDKDKEGPLVMILHGFEGSIDSHYAKSMLKQVGLRGWRGLFIHFRGCSGEPNRLARGYHSGETLDFAYVVNRIIQREPNVHLAAIGYSLGGNVLLKWLGQTGRNNPLKAAVAISVPFELHKAATRIQQGFSRFYQWYFLRCIKERLSSKFLQVPPPFDPALLNEVTTVRDFDDEYTAPLHGFNDVDEYYTTASSRQYLRTIHVPTLILHAKDDPFMTADVIPCEEELSPYVTLEVTKNGGHVGFVGGKFPWKPHYWLDDRIPFFLQQHLQKKVEIIS